MANDNMEVDAAEAKLKTMEHSEQHYFKRYIYLVLEPLPTAGALRAHCAEEAALLTGLRSLATITMVSVDTRSGRLEADTFHPGLLIPCALCP